MTDNRSRDDTEDRIKEPRMNIMSIAPVKPGAAQERAHRDRSKRGESLSPGYKARGRVGMGRFQIRVEMLDAVSRADVASGGPGTGRSHGLS